jgi:hypothetical protein
MAEPTEFPGFHRTYGVELLYREPPALDKSALIEALRRNCGNIDAPADAPLLLIFHLDHPVQYAEGSVPAQTMILRADVDFDPAEVDTALEQSWDWPAARDVVSHCRARVIVHDFLSSGLDHRERLDLFHAVLKSVLEVERCDAIYWRPSEHLVDPGAYLEEQRSVKPNPVFGAVNVRLFNISNGAPGEKLMDTLGLAALGLPDLQCHFTGLDPNDVGSLLYNTALYIFNNGDVIADGETLGLTPEQKWRCQHEDSLLGPERVVLDVDPGPPHAAGGRDYSDA